LMDSKDRKESKIRQREETLARRVGEVFDQMNPRGPGECPDAEVIAAYAEQALGSADSAQWEGHFAACARCRKILRVIAISADTPLAGKEVAQLGELVAAVRAPVEILGRAAGRGRPIFADWRTRWLAPALGVAAVLAVWFVMRPPWRTTDRDASETLIAQAPKEEVPLTPAPAEEDRLSKVAPPQDQKTQPSSPPDRFSANAPSFDSAAKGLSKGRADASNALDKISPNADEETNSLKRQEKKMGALPSGREIQPPPIPPPPLLPPEPEGAKEAPAAPQLEARAAQGTPVPTQFPQARAQANEAAPATPEVPRSTSQSGIVTGSAPQAGTTIETLGGTLQQKPSAGLPSNARNNKALAPLRPTGEYSALLKAPSGSTLWRAGNGGIIERSTDAGKTWVSQISPSQEDWLAGAVASDTVCWLAGRNGAIARTVDGAHWDRISLSAQAAETDIKLPDWIGITARDAQSATITASDGRKFATADGGKTWKLQ
jgi:hypothetical protein